ncbi:MAG: penicillin acylase family protein, partial [Sphingopyxis sp.]|nr:penicillin acylase family protein [Sphingopyxis sp.]
MLRKGLIGLLILLVAVAGGLALWEPFSAAPSKRAVYASKNVEIVRDKWGVPHIFGDSDADVAYGVAYAHAEDDFATLQEVMAMTRGRAGAMLGADGAKVDFAAHLLDIRSTVDRDWAKLPADVRILFDAYAAGLNRFADKHPGEVRLSRLFPVDGKDVVA